MLETHLRQAATVLLECAIRIAPPDVRDWGRGMLGELSHVEGPWAAVSWALGSAGTLAKAALVSLFLPGRRGQGIPSGPGLFARDVSVRKAALAVGGGCVLAALLFLAAPPFRQALRVSLRPWYWALQGISHNFQPGVEALARRAEQQRDAEGLAFCAVRLNNGAASGRLAREAVGLDPDLLWVYAVVAVRHPDLPEIGEWVPKLEHWDSQNALLPMIRAESNDIGHVLREDVRERGGEKDPVWRSAMAAAFRSPKFEDYLDRVEELDRKVVLRYGFYDPEEVLFEEDQGMPTYAVEDFRLFASSLIHSGEDLEAQGDGKGAKEKYWAVARFGQLIDSQGHTGSEHRAGSGLQARAYKKLEALSRKEGSQAEAALFSYLTAKFDPVSVEHGRFGGLIFGWEVCKRNAAVLLVTGLMMLIFSGLLVTTVSVLIAGSRRGARTTPEKTRPVATMVAMTSAVGLLLSSATLYLTYRPYWYIFQGAILNGDRTQAQDLRAFLSSTEMAFGVQRSLAPDYQYYFWTGVTLLGVVGLALILLRHILGRTRAPALRHSPRVP